MNGQFTTFRNITPMQARKLMQKRRDMLEAYEFTPYQLQAAQLSIRLKNRNFLRQLRSLDVEKYKFQFTQNRVDIYKNADTGDELLLKQWSDDYSYYQLEYFVEHLSNVHGYRHIMRFLAPQAVFYTTKQTYQFISTQQIRVKMVQLAAVVRELSSKDAPSKRTFSTAFYVFQQLISLLEVLHSQDLTLGGDFRNVHFINEQLKLDLVNMRVKVPPSLAEGIQGDLLQLKEMLFSVFGQLFKKHRPQIHHIEMLNEVFAVINDFLEGEQHLGLGCGMKIQQAATLLGQLPFFQQRSYPTFLGGAWGGEVLFSVEIQNSQPYVPQNTLQVQKVGIMERVEREIAHLGKPMFPRRPVRDGGRNTPQQPYSEEQRSPSDGHAAQRQYQRGFSGRRCASASANKFLNVSRRPDNFSYLFSGFRPPSRKRSAYCATSKTVTPTAELQDPKSTTEVFMEGQKTVQRQLDRISRAHSARSASRAEGIVSWVSDYASEVLDHEAEHAQQEMGCAATQSVYECQRLHMGQFRRQMADMRAKLRVQKSASLPQRPARPHRCGRLAAVPTHELKAAARSTVEINMKLLERGFQ